MRYKIISILVMAVVLFSGCGAGGNTPAAQESSGTASSDASSAAASSEGGFGKVLVVYYSLSGNTREVGNLVKDMTGADVFEIEPEENYFRSDIEEIGKKQVNEGYKPKLKNSVKDIGKYDLIFIGSPVWWFSVSPPVMSFLSQYDLKGKKVVPFCTCGSDYGKFFDMFKEACPGAEVLAGEDFTSSEIKDGEHTKEKIKLWLDELKSTTAK